MAAIAARGLRASVVVVWVLTGLGVPLLLGFAAADLNSTTLVVYVVLVVLSHIWAERRAPARDAAQPS